MFTHHDLACSCTPEQAWQKVEDLTDQAVKGDSLAYRLLAWHVEHALALQGEDPKLTNIG